MAQLKCPTCGRTYDESHTHCDDDFAVLVPQAPATPAATPAGVTRPAAAGAPWPGCSCGAPVTPGADECDWCGSTVAPPSAPPPPPAPAAESTAATATAESLRGPWGSVEVGVVPLELGRGSATPAIADALADLDIVSRHHAEIVRHEGAVWLRDVESSNGTFVNNRRLEPGRPVLVRPGDAIRLGSSVHLELGAQT